MSWALSPVQPCPAPPPIHPNSPILTPYTHAAAPRRQQTSAASWARCCGRTSMRKPSPVPWACKTWRPWAGCARRWAGRVGRCWSGGRAGHAAGDAQRCSCPGSSRLLQSPRASTQPHSACKPTNHGLPCLNHPTNPHTYTTHDEQADASIVLSRDPCPLSQMVLLSLVQQLSADLTTSLGAKLAWIREAALQVGWVGWRRWFGWDGLVLRGSAGWALLPVQCPDPPPGAAGCRWLALQS